MSLLELNVAAFLLVLSLAGTAFVIAAEIGQLMWIEKKNQLYTSFVMTASSGTLNAVISTELAPSYAAAPAKQRVEVQSYQTYDTSATATVSLNALSPWVSP
jgi:hypothetical protein